MSKGPVFAGNTAPRCPWPVPSSPGCGGRRGLPRWTVCLSRSFRVWLLPPLCPWPHVPCKEAGQGGVREGHAGRPTCEAGSQLRPTAAGTTRLRSESHMGSAVRLLTAL